MTSGRKSKAYGCLCQRYQDARYRFVLCPFSRERALRSRGSPATGGELRRALASKEFVRQVVRVFFAPISGRGYLAGRMATVGLGPNADFTADRARRAATAAALAARQKRIGRIAFVLEGRLDTS